VTEEQLWEIAEQVMTPAQFNVFVSHHRDGLSQRTIAKDLGVSRSTVQSRLEGGRRRLLEAVKQEAA
jgi:RNA polymerase sigma factor (sigma-70 family)